MKPAWSRWLSRPLVVEYLAAVLLVAAAAIITDQLRHRFPATPNSLFFCAVIVSAWLGGLGPGLLASLLSSTAIIFWLSPPTVASPNLASELPRFIVFLLASFFITWLCNRQKRAQDALQQARDELELRVQERTRDVTVACEGLKTEVAERKRAETALRQSEARLEEAQRVAHIGHWQRDTLTDLITFSDEALRIFGLYPRSTPVPLSEFHQLIHPDDQAFQRQALLEALQGSRRFDVEFRILLPGGEVRFVHALGDVTRDESSRPVLVFGTVQDITARKQVELLMNGQRRVLEMIAAGVPLSESLTALVRLIEAHTPGMLGSILLTDKPGLHLCHCAAPDLPPEYIAALDGLTVGPNVGSCGTAAWCKEPVFVENIATDPRWQGYVDLALSFGLRACWSTPIFGRQNRVIGTFAMYYRQPGRPTPEHLCLIETTTHIAAIAITRDQDQAGLRESEAKLKEAQRIAKIGYWEIDIAADHITWSEETWRIFGLPPQDRPLRKAELLAMIHPDDRPIRQQAFDRAVRERQPYNAEYRIIPPNGEIRFIQIRDEIVFDPSGRPVRMFGTVQDVTERKRAEALLRAQEQEIAAIVENSPDPIVRFDRELRRTYVNPAFTRVNGGARDALVGKKFGSAVREGAVDATPEELETLHQSLQTVLEKKQPLDLEATWPLPTGRRHYSIHLEPEFDAHGSLTSILSIGRDITERKRVEETMRENQQLFNLVLATLPVGVTVTNQAGDLVLVNAASKRIWGDTIVSGDERWARTKGAWHDSGRPLAPGDWASVRALTEGKTSLNELIDIETYDGQRKTIQNSSAPIRNADGRIVGALIVNEDVTERVRTEEALRQTQTELTRVARVTMMGELTASIAHEVNQPLAAVASNADAVSHWLAAVPPNLAEAREAAQRIARDAARAGKVIRRIRDLLKKGEPARTPFNLNDLIQETIALARPEITRRKVSLQTRLALELPSVPADRVQLQQLLLNLVMNALDAMGTVTDRQRVLCISTAQPEPHAIQVAVQDNGVGIDPQTADHLYDPFYTTKPDGLGMGLAISRSIIEAHGGRLWATPNVDHGVTFQFTLPVPNGAAL